jgi:uncharacterized cupin superfamily protein
VAERDAIRSGRASTCSNDTDQPARYLMISNNASPDAVEYPDLGLLSVMAYTQDQFGKPLWDSRKIDPPAPDGKS